MKKIKPHYTRKNDIRLRIKRNIADVIDLFICVVGAFSLFWLINFLNFSHDDQLVSLFCVIAMLIVYTCKDLLRPSVGNRIMKLNIILIDGSDCVPTRKLIMRNLSFGLNSLDIVVIGSAIGTQRKVDKRFGIAVIEE